VPDRAVVADAMRQVVMANDLTSARLRVTVTGGDSPLGSERGAGGPTVVVAGGALAAWPPTADVVVVPWTRNERSAVAGLKTTSYAENVVALARAHEHGASEALLANTRDELCEGTGSNVVVVLDGATVTPPLDSGCLAGITRELLLEWARGEGVAIEERAIGMAELARAQEVLLTSSTRHVQPAHRVADRGLEPGPVGAQLAALFGRHAAEDVDP
jgi:branched-chain amino acid aminotransferase